MNLQNYQITIVHIGVNDAVETRQHVQTARDFKEVMDIISDWIEETGNIVKSVEIIIVADSPAYLWKTKK